MKAISVWQPWAQLLAEGKKSVETRSWATKYRGQILIHAAKQPAIKGYLMMATKDRKILRELMGLEGNIVNLAERFPTGAIIGMANLVDCQLIDESYRQFVEMMCPIEFAFGDFAIGRYAWKVQEPVLFEEPIFIGGRQGLWNYDEPLKKI